MRAQSGRIKSKRAPRLRDALLSEQPRQHGYPRSKPRMEDPSEADAVGRTVRLTGFENKKDTHAGAPFSRARFDRIKPIVAQLGQHVSGSLVLATGGPLVALGFSHWRHSTAFKREVVSDICSRKWDDEISVIFAAYVLPPQHERSGQASNLFSECSSRS